MERKRSRNPRRGGGGARDDLTRIQGVGASSAARLYDAGIDTFAALAALTPKRVAEVSRLATKRIERDDWIGQAAALAAPVTAAPGTGETGDACRPESESRRESFTLQLLVAPDNRVKRTLIEYVSVDEERTPKQAVDDWQLPPILDFIREHASLGGDALVGPPPSVADAPEGDDRPGIVVALSARKITPSPVDPAPHSPRVVCCLEIEVKGVTATGPESARWACLYHVACQALNSGDVHVISSGRIEFGAPDKAGAAMSSGPIQVAVMDLPVGTSRLLATAMLPDQDLAASTVGPVLIVHE